MPQYTVNQQCHTAHDGSSAAASSRFLEAAPTASKAQMKRMRLPSALMMEDGQRNGGPKVAYYTLQRMRKAFERGDKRQTLFFRVAPSMFKVFPAGTVPRVTPPGSMRGKTTRLDRVSHGGLQLMQSMDGRRPSSFHVKPGPSVRAASATEKCRYGI
jgi:hypothetical protein